jgi:hypothetical protein
MSNAYRDKLLSIGYLGHGRTRTRVVEEGRTHPESGDPFITRRDELGNDVTEHGKRGAGVSDRQDVHIHQREPVVAEIEIPREQMKELGLNE